MHLTRRGFIHMLTVSAGTALLPFSAVASGTDDFAVRAKGKRLLVGGAPFVHMFDKDTLQPKMTVNVGFLAHSFLFHPKHPEKLWTIERYKPVNHSRDAFKQFRASEIDLNEKAVTRTIQCAVDSDFRGHGLIVPESDTIFIVRFDNIKKESYLTGYDIGTGKVVEDYLIGRCESHETRLMQDGTAMVASGSNELQARDRTEKSLSASAYIDGILRMDINTGKILTRSFIVDAMEDITHFELLSDGRIIALSKSTVYPTGGPPARIYIGQEGGELKAIGIPEALERTLKPSEYFNIALEEKSGTIAVSDYMNRMVFIFDLHKLSYVAHETMDIFSVALDKEKGTYTVCGESIRNYDHGFKQVRRAFSPDNNIRGPFFGSHAIIV